MHRKRIVLTVSLLLLVAGKMQATPDPDIFDGRTVASKQGSASTKSKTSQASNGGAGSLDGASSDKMNEILDALDRMGGTTWSGKSIAKNSSKTGSSGGAGGEPQEGNNPANVDFGKDAKKNPSSEGNADLGTQKEGQASGKGTGTSGNPPESSEATTERNFENFGFGSGLGTEVKEIPENSSKASTQSSESGTGDPLPVKPTKQTGGSGNSGSKPVKSNPKGDYGKTLPSGI